MFEGLFSIVTVIAEAFIAVISALVEFMASFFFAAGEMLSIIDLVALLVILFFKSFFGLFYGWSS